MTFNQKCNDRVKCCIRLSIVDPASVQNLIVRLLKMISYLSGESGSGRRGLPVGKLEFLYGCLGNRFSVGTLDRETDRHIKCKLGRTLLFHHCDNCTRNIMSKFHTLSSGKKIPNIGFGTYAIRPCSSVVYQACKAGWRLFDTAIMYHNEAEVAAGISKWLKEDPANNKREDIFYQTKLLNSQHGYEKAKRAIADSLSRAKDIGYIDLYLIHDPMSSKKLRLETWKALQEAVESGHVKSIGVSNFGVHHLEELLQWEGLTIPPVVDQVELNPWLQRTDIHQFCDTNNIILEAYSPLTQGYKLKDPELLALAKKYNKEPAQILIRWSLQKGFIPLPRSSTASRAISNFDVFDFELSPDDFNNLGDPNAYEYFDWDPTTH